MGFRVSGLVSAGCWPVKRDIITGFTVSGLRICVSGFGSRGSRFAFHVSGFGFRVPGFVFKERGKAPVAQNTLQGVLVRGHAGRVVINSVYGLTTCGRRATCLGSEAGSYLRLIDFCITQL